MRTKAEAGERRPQAQGCLEPPKLEEIGRTLPQTLRKEAALLTSGSGASGPQMVGEQTCVCKPPTLWSFVTGAPGH